MTMQLLRQTTGPSDHIPYDNQIFVYHLTVSKISDNTESAAMPRVSRYVAGISADCIMLEIAHP